jgi:hypothetical protein
MLLGMQAQLHDTLLLFSSKLLRRRHLGDEGCVLMRREIASVRLLTVHLGLELVPPGKALGSCRGGILESLNSPDWGEANAA